MGPINYWLELNGQKYCIFNIKPPVLMNWQNLLHKVCSSDKYNKIKVFSKDTVQISTWTHILS